ncbi:MAG: nucleotidyl transferase AbiEii/AbiGii toxin family protein [Bifidobacteriaceae bacterium]|jgi:hypothetical protein|nr:nucleotidyl transferase AbiEii/AbiGii toxin family protein [Bifidobacteriaceae bacterium]
MLEGFHLRVSRIVLEAVEPFGFALGGGYALQAHGVVDRPSKDLDTYTANMDVAVFDAAERTVVTALRREGFNVHVVKSDSWFRALRVADADNGDVLGVDLGYDYRRRKPVAVAGIGPVLALDDVVVGKVRALWDRQAARDYIDVDALMRESNWTVEGLQAVLDDVRPEAGPGTMSELLRQADTVAGEEYAAYGLTADDVSDLICRLRSAT